MDDYKKKYYEQSEFWDKDFQNNSAEINRLKEILEIIPKDVQTVLDVGAGNGFFVNSLKIYPGFVKIVGLDQSKEALKHVQTERVLGSISNLPFENSSFDLVTCLEVLEHLPQDDFKKGILELQRVSKKYILITVPNENNLEHSLVMCPECYCWFNPYFHMRSFNKENLKNLLNNFNLIQLKEIGPISKEYCYPSLLLTFFRNWKKPLPLKTSICPQCGYQNKYEKTENFHKKKSNFALFSLLESLTKLVFPKKEKHRWFLALYQKK
jgi:ubiquinone/menaquinone biosynthesis C-methylase UbiE